ncbi:MAG: glycoside hydrolase family 3 N-terminal domain-containing protein [Ktedonobacterales bacterium]
MEKHNPMGSVIAPSVQDAHVDQVQTIEVPMEIPATTLAHFDPIADATTVRTPVAATYSQQQSVGHAGRTVSRPRRLPLTFAVLLVVLVLAVAIVPLLQMLSLAQRPHVGLTPTLTPTAPSAAQGTPNRHAFDWVGQTQNAAQVAYVNQMLSHMTLDEKIGQMIMIEFEESQMTDGLAYEISHYHVGSVILYAYNILNPDQTRSLDQAIQANAKIPVLISTDQEGGSVNRLAGILGPLPSAAEVGATNNPNFAKQRGEQDAKTLYSLGINANLAPVVDVLNTPTGGGAIGDRAFGSTPQQVTEMAGAYLTGLQENHQVVGCLKHFPGLGAVEQDPHKALTTLDRDLSTLEQVDWAPYASLIATGQVEMVMVTHVVMPAVDPDRPASLSKPMITGILRDKLHFNGVVMTDGIYMKALSAHYSFDQIVLYAVEAGVDIISSTYSLSSTNEAFNVIKNAVLDGTLSQKQIDDSVWRILLTKLHYGILAMPSAR